MTPEQAAAVARVREAATQANLCMPPLSTVIVATDDAAAILAALEAAQAAAQAPIDVPRLTDADIRDALADMSHLQMPINKLIPAIARAVETRVREMCGVAP